MTNLTARRRPSPSIPAPLDVERPGVMDLHIDATDVDRAIFQVRQIIPANGSRLLTLLYPKWLPGYHSPQGQIELLAGLQITADGRNLTWWRDPVEVFAFHVDVPADADAVEARFQFLSPTSASHGRILVTPDLMNLQWHTVALYPAGYAVRRIQVRAAVTLPSGWAFGCALEAASGQGDTTEFQPVSLDVLIDSPMVAGRHVRQIELDPSGPVRFNLIADRADLLAATEDQIQPHRALIVQADKLFGARHFDHYDFLVALSDGLGGIGVEHRRSCEIGTAPAYFTEWEATFSRRDVMAHEYVHSWNGKYRRGADSATPTFEEPIGDSLLWVYEGQTQYWGHVLAARSGLWTRDQALEALAQTAAVYDNRPGRRWRPLSDTTLDPIIGGRRPQPWTSWQRSEDYYSEGQLIWLEADTLIRELSGGARSLDDFAHAFFGPGGRDEAVRTYGFDDVVAELEALASHDWAIFLTERLESHEAPAPLGGLVRGGYRLVYRPEPSSYSSNVAALLGNLSLTFSVGVSVSSEGVLQEVIWESPAFAAGLTAGARIIAVNGRAYSADALRAAVIEAQSGGPLELLIKRGDHYRQCTVDYRGGLRYPHLEVIPGVSQTLDEIYAPRA